MRAAALTAACLIALIIALAATAVAQHAKCYYTQYDGGICLNGTRYQEWSCAGGGYYFQPDGPCIVA